MSENTLPPELAAQVAEAADRTTDPVDVKIKTKTITWHGRAWQVRAKPGAVFMDAYEGERPMAAARAVLGAEQYEALLALDADVEGDDGVEGLFEACNVAWGVKTGN